MAGAIERLWWTRPELHADAPDTGSTLPPGATVPAPTAAWLQVADRIALRPLSMLYGAATRLRRHWYRRRRDGRAPPVPVIVVGNVVVGGAGKTPTVIAIVQALIDRGWTPGVVSRGYGAAARERNAAPLEVTESTPVGISGDEPQLIRRRTGVPVWVARERLRAVRALCVAHPRVDIVVADDGLQHLGLPRDLEIVVYDERGVGNGRLLPAGPLREPAGGQGARIAATERSHARDARSGPPSGFAPAGSFAVARAVAYNAAVPSTRQPGYVLGRRLVGGWTLAQWREGWHAPRPLAELSALARSEGNGTARPRVAAGIGAPEKFHAMLRHEGVEFEAWPLADHANLDRLPWPDDGRWTFVTEKDAVRIAPGTPGSERVIVVGLDLTLPAAMQRWLEQSLPTTPGRRRRALGA